MIRYALATEKSIRLIEEQNKLVFVVDRKDKKQDIKKELEERFEMKVLQINTLITPQGQKKAYVKFASDSPAIDLATNLGIM